MAGLRRWSLGIVLAFGLSLLSGIAVQAERTEFGYGGWTKTFGADTVCLVSNLCNSTNGVAVAQDHSVVAVGYFAGSNVNFNPDGSDLHSSTAAGNSVDAFIVRWDNAGNYLWGKSFGAGTSGNHFDAATDVEITSSGNIVVSGQFTGTVNFNPDGSDDHTAVNSVDTFVSVWSLDGVYQWTKTFGGDGIDAIEGLVLDNDNNIYMTGRYAGTNTDFNPDAGTDLHSVNNVFATANIFFSKWLADGTYQWSKTFGSASVPGDEPSDVEYADGHIFLSGSLQDSTDVNFNPDGLDLHDPSVEGEVFISRWSTTGIYDWTFMTEALGSGYGTPIAASEAGDLFVGGSYDGVNVDLDPTAGTDLFTSDSGTNDMYFSKYDHDGNYQWSYVFDGSSFDDITGIEVATDNSAFYDDDSLYVVGEMGSQNVDLDPTGGSDIYSAATNGLWDVVIQRYDLDGNYEFTRVLPGGDNDSSPLAVAADENRDIYVGGYYAATSVNFNPDGSDIHTTGAESNAFITKWQDRFWQHILNLEADHDTEIVSTKENVELGQPGVPRGNSDAIRLLDTDLPLADIDVDFPLDNDWDQVTGDTSLVLGKSFVHDLSTAPGTADSFTLYVPHLAGFDTVAICPDAASMAEVDYGCPNIDFRQTDHPDVSLITIDSNEYWKVDNLTGTGGFNAEFLAETGSPATINPVAGITLVASALLLTRHRPIILSRYH